MTTTESTIIIDEGNDLGSKDLAFKVYMTEIKRTWQRPVYELHTEGNFFTESSPAPDYCALLSKARLLDASRTPYLRSNYQKLLTRMIGEAIALAVRGELSGTNEKQHLEKANTDLDRAEQFMKDRAGETVRINYVRAIVVVLILLYTPFVLLNYLDSSPASDRQVQVSREVGDEKTVSTVKLYALAFVGGALGAGFSLLTRVGKLTIDPKVDRWAHYEEVIFRLTVGALAALIIVIGLEANVFVGFAEVSSADGRITEGLYHRTFWFLLISSIAAGFSEQFVPSLLEQFAKKADANGVTDAA